MGQRLHEFDLCAMLQGKGVDDLSDGGKLQPFAPAVEQCDPSWSSSLAIFGTGPAGTS